MLQEQRCCQLSTWALQRKRQLCQAAGQTECQPGATVGIGSALWGLYWRCGSQAPAREAARDVQHVPLQTARQGADAA